MADQDGSPKTRHVGRPRLELPEDWTAVEERDGETYQWPEYLEHYTAFTVYEGTNASGRIRLAVGECDRTNTWGRDRKYYIVFYVTAGDKRPLVEFLEADDYEETHELIAVIRGSDGGRKMYGPQDELPREYTGFRVETYRDRILARGSWNKLAVVAEESDAATMMGHALIQGHLRFGITPHSQPTN